jgi:hypothetical protein
MTKKELTLVVSALYYAAEWERSLADSWSSADKREEESAKARAREYMALRKKLMEKTK